MAVAMFMSWAGVTAEQYDAVRTLVNWEGDPAPGGLFHVAATDEHGLHVTDIWESPEACQSFLIDRLMPGVARLGITSQPAVELLPIHALFTPGFKPTAP